MYTKETTVILIVLGNISVSVIAVCLPQISFNFLRTSPGPFPSLIQASIWAECKLKLLFCIDQQTKFPKEKVDKTAKKKYQRFSVCVRRRRTSAWCNIRSCIKTKLKLKNTKNGTAQRTLDIDLILYYRELNSVLWLPSLMACCFFSLSRNFL